MNSRAAVKAQEGGVRVIGQEGRALGVDLHLHIWLETGHAQAHCVDQFGLYGRPDARRNLRGEAAVLRPRVPHPMLY